MKKAFYLLLLVIIVVFTCYEFQDTKENLSAYSIYQLDKNWPHFPEKIVLGNPTGIGIDTNQHIFIFCRAGREWPLLTSMPNDYIRSLTILELDNRTGMLINSWGKDIFIMPHGLTVDHQNNIWVTDVGLNQIFKFSHDGKLLLTLGEAKVSGNDASHFNQPTDIAVTKGGSFYVSDGYKNSRIIKFSVDGKFLFQWGSKGNEEGEFNIPHAVTLDTSGNVYVADRENSRVQIFTPEGKFIKQYKGNFGNICSVAIDRNQQLVAVDDVRFFKLKHRGSDVLMFDSAGHRFGRNSKTWYHDIAIDKDNNIYVADIMGNTIQKFSLPK